MSLDLPEKLKGFSLFVDGRGYAAAVLIIRIVFRSEGFFCVAFDDVQGCMSLGGGCPSMRVRMSAAQFGKMRYPVMAARS